MEKRNDNNTITLEVAMVLYALGITFEINDGKVVKLFLEADEIQVEGVGGFDSLPTISTKGAYKIRIRKGE